MTTILTAGCLKTYLHGKGILEIFCFITVCLSCPKKWFFYWLENRHIHFLETSFAALIRENYKCLTRLWEKPHWQRAISWRSCHSTHGNRSRLHENLWHIKFCSHFINSIRYERNRSMSSLRNFDFKTYTARQKLSRAFLIRIPHFYEQLFSWSRPKAHAFSLKFTRLFRTPLIPTTDSLSRPDKTISYKVNLDSTREQGWRSGESARLPAVWPGFDSRTRLHI